jgi:hypothetical protein
MKIKAPEDLIFSDGSALCFIDGAYLLSSHDGKINKLLQDSFFVFYFLG